MSEIRASRSRARTTMLGMKTRESTTPDPRAADPTTDDPKAVETTSAADPGALSDDQRYAALVARDTRFDGTFFVAVTSTGIYCRPVCPARTPRRVNCRFYSTAALAEESGFRPCLRCRPESAPGLAPIDQGALLARRALAALQAASATGGGIDEVAEQLDIGARQLRRIVRERCGVTPLALIRSQRLLLARRLLGETELSVTEVALASGFSSVRQFGDAFRERYGSTPTEFRRNRGARAPGLDLELAYRPPYARRAWLDFVRPRAIPGVEWVEGGTYSRIVAIDDAVGEISAAFHPERDTLVVRFSETLVPVLSQVLWRVRSLFDLEANPAAIDAALSVAPELRAGVTRCPGLRAPGAFDAFETSWRAVLGQQVSVAGATTLAGRLVARFGRRVESSTGAEARATPLPEGVAQASIDDVAGIGVPRARAKTLVALARWFAEDPWRMDAGADDAAIDRELSALPGVGPWTRAYLAMRVLRWPDAFPASDLGVRKALGGVSAPEAEARSRAWRPWRTYAAFHLWHGLTLGAENDDDGRTELE